MNKRDNRWRTDATLWEKLKPIAHEMRSKPTEAEKELWKYLRKHQLHGLSFRRQHCIGQFIVDFYCARAKLVIEVDGSIHQYQPEEDAVRQVYLESHNLRVLRFANDTVLDNMNEVLKQISSCLPKSH